MAVISDGTHKTPNYTSSGVPFLSVQNISSGRLEMGKSKYIAEEEHKKLCERIAPQKGDILLCRIGTLGKAIKVYWDFEFSIFVSLGVLRPILSEIADYIVSFINSPIGFRWIQSVKVGGGTHTYKINLNDIPQMLICIPPLEEQYRISNMLNLLNDKVIHYGRLQEKLDELSGSLNAALKKSILQEAIQGKLTSQDPTDEPASVLLDRIRVEKEKLLKVGKIKKKDIVDSAIFKGEDNKYYEKVDGKTLEISEEIPFDIPESWAWVRLGSVVTNEAGLAYSKDCLTDRSQPLIRVLRGGNIEEGRWSIKEDDVIISKKYVKESLLLKRGTFITPAVTSIERMAKTALIQEDHHDIVVGGFVLMIKPVIIDNALLQYLNLFFQTTYYKKYCISITNKSGQAFYNLSRQKLMQCLVPIPPEKEQYRIADIYSQLTL